MNKIVELFSVPQPQYLKEWRQAFLAMQVGFILHTTGFAAIGVVIACVAGLASATGFIVLTGWATAFYLWYVTLAVLILAVPIRGWIKWSIAISAAPHCSNN